jgi:uncharacterized protein
MLKNRIVIIGILIVFISIVIYTLKGGEETYEKYASKLEIERKETNRFMRSSDESPLSPEEKKVFKGLNFFAPNPKYKVTAKLVPVEMGKLYMIPTTDGQERKYVKHAFAEFELEGNKHRLLLLQDYNKKADNELFLPFSDATNGRETYGGGRYLEVKIKKKDQKIVELDFNKAFNPYCVFNYSYSCPLPPKENILSIPIYAGEKNYDPVSDVKN